MPEKRKRGANSKNNGVAVKKSKSDFVNVIMANSSLEKSGSSSDDSDGEMGAFPAFDLPSYGNAFNEQPEPSDEEEEETPNGKDKEIILINDSQESTAGTSTAQNKSGSNEIIFLSDPSQLPTPLNFSTPTVMKPVVIGPGTSAASQVILMNQVAGGAKGMQAKVPLVQPMIIPSSQPNSRSQTMQTLRNNSASKLTQPAGRTFDTHVAVPVMPKGNLQVNNSRNTVNQRGNVTAQRVVNNQRAVPSGNIQTARQQHGNTKQPQMTNQRSNVNQRTNNRGQAQGPPVANALANAAASAVAAGMSASSIMQQVAQAAQAAVKSALRPQAMSTPNKPMFQNLPSLNTNAKFSPVVGSAQRMPQKISPINQNGNIKNANSGQVRTVMPVGRQRSQREFTDAQMQSAIQQQNGTLAEASKWKPYSNTLAKVSRKVVQSNAKTLGITPGSQLNLKQMYNLLRLKFNTKQIYDMCLWDMEHADASLMEIAITNAFS